jgi:hypothetical protein
VALSGRLRNDRHPSALGSEADILAGENSSNLRPLTLECRRAGNLGWSEKITCPPAHVTPTEMAGERSGTYNPPTPNHTADA